MNTEEDTFNKLRKPPFNQIEDIIFNNRELIMTDSKLLVDILRQHGWSYAEYLTAYLNSLGGV